MSAEVDVRSNVVALPGVTVDRPLELQPHALVIERLRNLLAQAERGEIRGIAYAYVTERASARDGIVPGDSDDYALAMGLSCLFHRFFAEAVAGSSDVEAPAEPS